MSASFRRSASENIIDVTSIHTFCTIHIIARMDKIQAVLLLTCLFGFVNLVVSQAKMEQSDDGTSGKLSFSTPDLNDEEAHSQFMPEQLKCDGCTVVALKVCLLISCVKRLQIGSPRPLFLVT